MSAPPAARALPAMSTPATPPSRRRRVLGLGALFVAGAALSALTMLNGIQPNDEGLMLQAAHRIAGGQVPYGDFWWFYPPGQPFLLAGLEKVFGVSLLPWRVVRVLADSGVALLAFALAGRYAPRPLALVAWLAAACAMAFPSGPHPYPLSLAFALGALVAFPRRPLLAGVLTALCAAWRLEFAAFTGLGILLALAVAPGPGRDRGRSAAGYAGASVLAGTALYLPVVIAAGLRPSWELIVRYPLLDFRDYQSLPLPTRFRGAVDLGSPSAAIDSFSSVLHFYLPLMELVGLAGALAVLALRFRRERWPQVATAILALGMASYLLVRPDFFHTPPLGILVLVLGSWALAEAWPLARSRRSTGRDGSGAAAGRRRPAAAAALAFAALASLGAAWVMVDGVEHRIRGATDDFAGLDLPVADGVRVEPAQRPSLRAAVRYVEARVPPGRPIYVASRRADLVTAGAPLFYTLAQRENPTRYDIQAPGVVTTAPVQREIIGDLERTRPPLVVRWTDPSTAAPEPNRAGESSGVRLLDAYLARAYAPAARFGEWSVLRRRGG